jgi:hypothetical protein
MLWTFQRKGEQLVYEIRLSADTGGFELAIHQPDGTETVERFTDSAGVDRRALELQQQLLNDGWWLAGDPRR